MVHRRPINTYKPKLFLFHGYDLLWPEPTAISVIPCNGARRRILPTGRYHGHLPWHVSPQVLKAQGLNWSLPAG